MSTSPSKHHQWLDLLRQRLVSVAARRVRPDDVDDVVQEAMRIIVEKRLDRSTPSVDGQPPIAWCFNVLRNVVGNYYRRRETHTRRTADGATGNADTAGGSPDPRALEAMESIESLHVIEGALKSIRASDPQCGKYLLRLVEGASPQEIASADGLDAAVFYRRLYRCRQKLRSALLDRGVTV